MPHAKHATPSLPLPRRILRRAGALPQALSPCVPSCVLRRVVAVQGADDLRPRKHATPTPPSASDRRLGCTPLRLRRLVRCATCDAGARLRQARRSCGTLDALPPANSEPASPLIPIYTYSVYSIQRERQCSSLHTCCMCVCCMLYDTLYVIVSLWRCTVRSDAVTRAVSTNRISQAHGGTWDMDIWTWVVMGLHPPSSILHPLSNPQPTRHASGVRAVALLSHFLSLPYRYCCGTWVYQLVGLG